jgi:hypothetical protein
MAASIVLKFLHRINKGGGGPVYSRKWHKYSLHNPHFVCHISTAMAAIFPKHGKMIGAIE